MGRVADSTSSTVKRAPKPTREIEIGQIKSRGASYFDRHLVSGVERVLRGEAMLGNHTAILIQMKERLQRRTIQAPFRRSKTVSQTLFVLARYAAVAVGCADYASVDEAFAEGDETKEEANGMEVRH